MKPRNMCRWISFASVRNADSRRRWKAPRLPSRRKSRSCDWWWKLRASSGASSQAEACATSIIQEKIVAELYRAEVIGSMLRPAYLKEARVNWTAGKMTTRAFKEVEDRAVDDA